MQATLTDGIRRHDRSDASVREIALPPTRKRRIVLRHRFKALVLPLDDASFLPPRYQDRRRTSNMSWRKARVAKAPRPAPRRDLCGPHFGLETCRRQPCGYKRQPLRREGWWPTPGNCRFDRAFLGKAHRQVFGPRRALRSRTRTSRRPPRAANQAFAAVRNLTAMHRIARFLSGANRTCRSRLERLLLAHGGITSGDSSTARQAGAEEAQTGSDEGHMYVIADARPERRQAIRCNVS